MTTMADGSYLARMLAHVARTSSRELFTYFNTYLRQRAGLLTLVHLESDPLQSAPAVLLALLQKVQRIAPEFRTVYLTSSRPEYDTVGVGAATRSKWTGDFDVNAFNSVPNAIQAAGGKYWSPDSWGLDKAQVTTAHELGIKVTVWTVNEPEEMAKFIDMGVDGIITDYLSVVRWLGTLLAFWSGGSGSLGCGLNYAAFS